MVEFEIIGELFKVFRGGGFMLSFLRSVIVLFAATTALLACGYSANSSNSSSIADGIIGGQNVSPNESLSRSIVALYDVQAKALCTASIVSSKYLLTAAHCVRPGATNNVRVVFGTDITNKASIVGVGTIAGAVQSPLWATNQNKPTNTGDFALIRLATALPAGYVPVPILTDASALQAGTAILLAGYGITSGRKDPKSLNDNGAGVLRQVVTRMINPAFSETESMVDESQGKGACHGDSGGPAYVQVAGKLMLFGVTSRGTDQYCSKGVVYTNIIPYLKWLPMAAQQLEAQIQRAAGVGMPRFVANLQE